MATGAACQGEREPRRKLQAVFSAARTFFHHNRETRLTDESPIVMDTPGTAYWQAEAVFFDRFHGGFLTESNSRGH